jgi:formiminotetrahydrofolate cyclodeaminase
LRKQGIALLFGVLVLALLVAGCGGSDDGGSASGAEGGTASAEGSSPEKEEFAAEVNPTCEKSNQKTYNAIVHAYGTPKVTKAKTEADAINYEVNIFVPLLIKDAEARLAAIQAATPPSEEEEEVKAIEDAYQAWIHKASNTPLKIVLANDIYNDARELSGKFPLVKCGLSPFEEP